MAGTGDGQPLIVPAASAGPMNPFRVSGSFLMGRDRSPFTIETLGDDENGARDRVLSTLGSRHRINRYNIKIDKVEKISVDDLSDPVVAKKIQMVK